MEAKLKQLLKTIKLNESLLSMLFGVVTVVLIGVLVFRMYRANKAELTLEGDKTQLVLEKVGEVEVEVSEDGKKYPVDLPEKVTVQAGDHLWAIAKRYYGSGYNWVDIAKANELKNPGVLKVGQELKMPKAAVITLEKVSPSIKGDSYTVVKGDNLWKIAVRAYADGYRFTEIAAANKLKNPNYIEVGQVLKLPR